MTYPTPGAYQEALQFPGDVFADPVLRACEPEMGPLGLPAAVTGAYAAVFPVRAASERWAVKLFTGAAPDVHTRYRAVARLRATHDLPYLVPFDYQREGIHVAGAWWPVVKMPWVEGMTLGRFIAAHVDAPATLEALGASWDALLADLETAGIAHGDLQHGNVLVRLEEGRPRLTLVDYDAMFVPALAGRRAAEVGHRNYQHPDRDARDFGPYLDRFAGLVVATALRALVVRPDLWAAHDTGENVLFRADDFYDPAASPLFDALLALPAVRPFAEALRAACLLEPEAAPSVAAVARGERVRAPVLSRRRERAPERAYRGPFEQWFGPAVGAWAVVIALLFAAGAVAAGLLALVGGVAAFGGAAGGRYRRLPTVRRRQRLRGEMAYFARVLAGLEEELADLASAHRSVFEDLDAVKAERLRELQEAALEDRLKHHFVGEASRFEGISHKVVVRLKAAGIRTAYQATPERVTSIRTLSDESKARVGLWRAGLVAACVDEVPDRLSPAEERRMDRLVARRAEALAAETGRVREKIRVQRVEQEAVRARLAGLPSRSFGRYLRELLRLAPLPAAPSPVPASPPDAPATPAEVDDGPWWR